MNMDKSIWTDKSKQLFLYSYSVLSEERGEISLLCHFLSSPSNSHSNTGSEKRDSVGGGDGINSVLPLAVPRFPSTGLRGEERDGICPGEGTKVRGTEKIPPSFCLPFPVFQPLSLSCSYLPLKCFCSVAARCQSWRSWVNKSTCERRSSYAKLGRMDFVGGDGRLRECRPARDLLYASWAAQTRQDSKTKCNKRCGNVKM